MAADQNSLFSLLAQSYGLQTALSLMSLFGGGSDAQKGFGAASAVGTGASGLGSLTGNPLFSNLGQDLSLGLGGAGLGYGLYNTLSNPKLSAGQKAGTAGLQIGEGAVAASPALAGATAGTALGPSFAALAPAAPYLAGLLAVQALSSGLEKSGSPQLRGAGKAIGGPILPITGLESVITGQQSPRAAANATIQGIRDTPVIGKVASPILDFFGLGTKPTTGTMFRKELGSIFNQIPQLKGTDTSKYQAPNLKNPLDYSMYDPQAVNTAKQLGQLLSVYAPDAKKAPGDYALQAENVLLNRFGNTMTPDFMAQILPLLQPQQQQTKVV